MASRGSRAAPIAGRRFARGSRHPAPATARVLPNGARLTAHALLIALVMGMLALATGSVADARQFRATGGCEGGSSGVGTPDVLIASDLPLTGASRAQTVQIVAAIRYILEQRGGRAGSFNVGYVSCDDSTLNRGKWDPGQCSRNANRYVATPELVALIGTFNSGCAAIVLPVVNKASGGAIPMVSPANTYPCLTEKIPGGCDRTEPAEYYPSGIRSYFRVTEHDSYQAIALAQLLRAEGRRNVFVLHDSEAYGLGVANEVRRAVHAVGLTVVGFAAWDPRARSYQALMQRVASSGADAVVLGGLIDENGDQVIRDKVAVLGPNNGSVRLYASDGFTTQQTIDEAGPASYGLRMTVAGVPTSAFPPKGRALAAKLRARVGGVVDPYAIYGAQVAEIVLDAIGRSDGTRTSVLEQLRRTNVTNGYLGHVRFRTTGDPAFTTGFTAYAATARGLVVHRVLRPTPELIRRVAGP